MTKLDFGRVLKKDSPYPGTGGEAGEKSGLPRSFSPGFYALGCWLARQTLGWWYRLRVEGLEYLPREGPAIICPKHQRWEDIPVVGMALPRPLHYIAKAELFRTPVQRELLSAWGGVPVDRERPRATLSSFKLLLPLLQDRAFIVLFPEGTYVPDRVGPGKHRLVQMLLQLQGKDGVPPLPFVPVGITYRPKRLGYRVAVKVGPPLMAAGPGEAPELTRALMDGIARLCGKGIENQAGI